MSQTLDPQKAYFYGQFVEAAYTMFCNPKGNNRLCPDPDGIPDGWELTGWIHMSDFLLTLKEPEFYGIVCREIANKDSRIVAIRGTESAIEWIDDAAALPTPFRQVPTAGRVASGFDRIYTSIKVVKRKLAEDHAAMGATELKPTATAESFAGSFADQLDQLATSREVVRGARKSLTESRPHRQTVVTGHSLGAALATLFVMENKEKKKFDVQTICTFASPRVGDLDFVRLFDQLSITSWRIVNKLDVVPKLPPHIPLVLEYSHVDTEYAFNSSSFAKNNLLCWHSMATYQHSLNEKSPLTPHCVK